MDLTPLIDQDSKIIQSYNNGYFKVNGEKYEHSILIAPHHVMKWVHGDNLSLKDFQPLIDISDTIDVVLIGTGSKTVFLEPSLKKELRANNLHIEVMDTGAACRTYNVLMSEARRVMCALQIVGQVVR
jgi:uncharacterized protein